MRIALSLFVLFSSLFSANFIHPDFSSCYKKNEKHFEYYEGYVAYPYKTGLSIVYSSEKKLDTFLKHDRYLGLYLVKTPKAKPIRFRNTTSISLGEWLGSADDSSLYAGNFAKKMDGLEANAQMASRNDANGFVMCLCCDGYGIATGDGGFIETEYIEHFVQSKDDSYGSLGVRFKQKAQSVYVDTVDPFCTSRVLEMGDIIISLDGKKVSDIFAFKRDILFGNPKQQHSLQIKRDGKVHTLKAILSKRFGGGLVSDTYLERFGLEFSSDLSLIKAESFGLKLGDRLLEIDGYAVKDFIDVRKMLSQRGSGAKLLFIRDGFEFFIDMEKNTNTKKMGLKAENYGY